jgi:hypothetical protein
VKAASPARLVERSPCCRTSPAGLVSQTARASRGPKPVAVTAIEAPGATVSGAIVRSPLTGAGVAVAGGAVGSGV